MEKNNCENMELNAKTKVGLSFKEVAWAISFIFALGWSYSDVQKDLDIMKQTIIQVENKQNKDDERYEKLYDVVNKIDRTTVEIQGQLKSKVDK